MATGSVSNTEQLGGFFVICGGGIVMRGSPARLIFHEWTRFDILSGQKANGREGIGERLKRVDQIERASQQEASPSDDLPETYAAIHCALSW
jgi:hypothetical protein